MYYHCKNLSKFNFSAAVVTGSAGFIGFHLCKRLLEEGFIVLGIDNFNNYYDVSLKRDRSMLLTKFAGFELKELDIINGKELSDAVLAFIERNSLDEQDLVIINLAAQAGVRYSIENPMEYVQSNMVGFSNILETSRKIKPYNLLFASSSSVYGLNQKLPFSEKDTTDHPISLYAATKKSNELSAHAYSHLYGLSIIGMRFFTVYGPYGRPDMALFKFAEAIINGKPIDLYNNGDMVRDFTYVDDVVNSIMLLADKPVRKTKLPANGYNLPLSQSSAGFRIFNIGQGKPIPLIKYVQTLEKELGLTAKVNYLPMQDGDVRETSAESTFINEYINYKPSTSVEQGIKLFVEWYNFYYKR